MKASDLKEVWLCRGVARRRAIALCFIVGASRILAADMELASPRGTFTIRQSHDGNWTSKLQFAKHAHPNITFTDTYPWPAQFYVSPDDQWILQVQKSGSGDNVPFLYRLDSSGRLWRMEQRFGELAFGYLHHSLGISVAELYHTGIAFTGWDLGAGVLRFTVRGSSTKNSGEVVNRDLTYDLQEHRFRAP